MSNFPSGDLIMDVVQAADAAKRQIAMQRLSDLSNTQQSASTSFEEALAKAGGATRSASSLNLFDMARAGQPIEGGPPTASKVARQFEAFVLQTFVEQMLPSEKTGLFGDEAAGGIWRSLMAEQLAATIARSGGIGIGKVLAHHLSNHEGRSEASSTT